MTLIVDNDVLYIFFPINFSVECIVFEKNAFQKFFELFFEFFQKPTEVAGGHPQVSFLTSLSNDSPHFIQLVFFVPF